MDGKMPGHVPLAVTTRGDALESVHYGSIAVVVLNTTDKELPYRLWINGKAAETTSLPHSIQTLIL